MFRGLWGRQSPNKRPHFCHERTFALFSGFPPNPHCHPTHPPGCGRKCCGRERWYTHLVAFFRTLTCSEAKNRHRLTFVEGYITQDLDSGEVFHGIGIFCWFFYIRTFWVIDLWKKCGQIRSRSWGLGLNILHFSDGCITYNPFLYSRESCLKGSEAAFAVPASHPTLISSFLPASSVPRLVRSWHPPYSPSTGGWCKY